MGDSQARISIFADDKASATVKSVQGGLQGLAAEAKRSILTGVGLAGGVAAFQVLGRAAGAAVDYVKDAIGAASDLAESQTKVAVVFGDSADEIEDWASTAATAFGQSSQQALEAVGTYGNLFRAFGIGQEAAGEMSKSLVELAADLASFNNTPVDQALVALRSGLSGETEPLKRFGIALNDARMRSVLLAKGVTDLGATLTAEQKATAAYAIIMSDSALAQGDFARTSDGLANQQRILEAQMANLSAEIGTQLLPIMVELAHVVTENVMPAVRDLFDIIKAIPWGEITGGISGVLNPLGAAQEKFESLAEAADRVPYDIARTWQHGAPVIENAAEDTFGPIQTKMGEAAAAAVEKARLLPAEVAKAMIDGQHDVEAGVTLLTELMNDEWTDATREAYYAGILASQQLADGLADADADVRSAAIDVRNNAIRELDRLKHGAYDAAAAATGALRSGLTFNATGIGQGVVYSYASGIYSVAQAAVDAASYVRRRVSGVLAHAGSPWYTGSRKIGEMVAKTYGQGIASGLGNLPSVSGLLPGGGGAMAPAMAGGGSLPPIYISLDGRELSESTARWGYFSQPGGPAPLPR